MKKDITTQMKEIKEWYTVPDEKLGITINQVEDVLNKIGKGEKKYVDCIWSLLDDELENFYDSRYHFCDGASAAHIGAYASILLGDSDIKSDREVVRDYIIKPLVEIGAVEPITYLKKKNKKVKIDETGFYPGHLVPKSPSLCYTISDSFIDLLQAYNYDDDEMILQWIDEESRDARLSIIMESESENKAKYIVDGHGSLICNSIDIYAKNFLNGYEVIYTDALDGDRITETERQKMDEIGLVFGSLDNVWPDVILYSRKKDKLWFIEAVTSDGEVDKAKMRGLLKICEDSNMDFGGATTTYPDYKTFAARQEKYNNLAIGSYVWIESKPDKVYKVK